MAKDNAQNVIEIETKDVIDVEETEVEPCYLTKLSVALANAGAKRDEKRANKPRKPKKQTSVKEKALVWVGVGVTVLGIIGGACVLASGDSSDEGTDSLEPDNDDETPFDEVDNFETETEALEEI